jgi:lactate racemase
MSLISVSLPYGEGAIHAGAPAVNLLGVYQIAAQQSVADEATLLHEALAHPIGSARLREIAAPGQRVAIVISDLTRPCPAEKMLPAVLDDLNDAGVRDADITVISALGLHRPMSEAELEVAVGPAIYRRVSVVNHDPADTIHLGQTTRGTPVELFRPLVEADVRVCLGNLEFHYFAGFSGGAKAILPGCASRAAINANHSMMVQPEAAAGRIAGNPVRADLEEGAALLGCDFILNVIVDEHHRIVDAVAGHMTEAHRAGCEMVERRGRVTLPERADIVLVSAGGYPKDVNLYQAQKALDNAAYAVRDGGVIILLAECREGFGNATFERWLREARTPADLLAWIQREFVLGGHKAAAVGAVLQRAAVYLISDMPAESVSACGMSPFADVETALSAALDAVGSDARIAVIPQGGSVLPAIRPA